MVYVYYNLRLQVKQIEKVPNSDAISFDDIDTTSKWRVEMEDPVMDEAPEWLEEEEEDDGDLLEEEGAEEDVDVPLPEDDYEDIEEKVDIQVQRRPIPMPLPSQSHTVGTGRRQLTLAYLLKQLELLVPPQAHLDHLHGHLLLLEEEWCPLPVKGVD